MKRYTLLFLTALTLLAATPASAQLCGYCDFRGDCWAWGGLGTACTWDAELNCIEWEEPYYCGGGGNASVAGSLSTEFAIASVEVVTPDGKETIERAQPVRTARVDLAAAN